MELSNPFQVQVHLSRQRLTNLANGTANCATIKGLDKLNPNKIRAVELLRELNNQNEEAVEFSYSDTLDKLNELQSLIDNPIELIASPSTEGISFTWKINIPPLTKNYYTDLSFSSAELQQLGHLPTLGYAEGLAEEQFPQETSEPAKLGRSFNVQFERLVTDFNCLPLKQQQLLERADSNFFTNVRILLDSKSDGNEKLTSFNEILAIAPNLFTSMLPSSQGMLIRLSANPEANNNLMFCIPLQSLLRQLTTISPQLQSKLVSAIAREPAFALQHARTIITNFSKFTLEQQQAINQHLLIDPTLNPSSTLGRMDAFDKPQQRKITAEFVTDARKHAGIILKNFEHFTESEQSEICKVLTSDSNFVKTNAGLLLHYKQHFEDAQIDSILQECLDALNFDTDDSTAASIPYLTVLFAHYDSLSSEQKADFQSAVLSNTTTILESNVAIILQYLHLFPQDDQQPIMRYIMDAELQTPLSQIISDNAGLILSHFALLSEDDCKKIDQLFPESQLAADCGILGEDIPKLSTQEKLLTLALLNFNKQQLAANKDPHAYPTRACRDNEIERLLYLVYRPQENQDTPPVPAKMVKFSGKEKEKIEEILKPLNAGNFDIRTLFMKIGYQPKEGEIIFSCMHPLPGLMYQNNTLYDNDMKSLQGTYRLFYKDNLIAYNHFIKHEKVLQPLLKDIYVSHENTLTIRGPEGDCRNMLS